MNPYYINTRKKSGEDISLQAQRILLDSLNSRKRRMTRLARIRPIVKALIMCETSIFPASDAQWTAQDLFEELFNALECIHDGWRETLQELEKTKREFAAVKAETLTRLQKAGIDDTTLRRFINGDE